MKASLIDARALKDAMYSIATVTNNESIFIDVIIDEIDNAQQVDAVEVVRCKDCKWYKPRNQSAHWEQTIPCCMRSASLKFPEDGFCSYGERKDNERKAD